MSISKKRTFFLDHFGNKYPPNFHTIYQTNDNQPFSMALIFPQNDQKKGAFFWDGHDKFGIFRLILGDDLGCVFSIFVKKKRTPIRHPKSQKVRFFHDFEKKVSSRWIPISFIFGAYIPYFFSKSWKKRTFCDFEWRIGVRFFFKNIGKTHLDSSPKIGLNFPNLAGSSQKNAPFFGPFWRQLNWNLQTRYQTNDDQPSSMVLIFPQNDQKKKVRFFEIDMINLWYLGRF